MNSESQQQRIMVYFIEEAKDHLQTIEQGVLNLQETLVDPESITEMFRAAHSIKGGAAMLGVGSVQHIAHRLEDYFKILKENSSIEVDEKLQSLLLAGFDRLQELIDHLQVNLRISDELASTSIAEIEPVLSELGSHLSKLVTAIGGTLTQEDAAPALATMASSTTTIPSRSAPTIFQTDVPTKLRDMLQLFKQSEGEVTRRQLQAICQELKQTGEEFQLRNWSQLVEAASRAIASPENSYRALAPVLIKDLVQAKDLVIAEKEQDICISSQLQELLPVAEVPQSLAEIEADEEFDSAFIIAEDNITTVDDLISSPKEEELFDEQASLNVEEFSWAEGDFEVNLNVSGPEVGAQELKSLASLFENEDIDLESAWEDIESNETLIAAHNSNQALHEQDDFADLFGDSASTEPNNLSSSNDLELNEDDSMAELFGGTSLANNDDSTTDEALFPQSMDEEENEIYSLTEEIEADNLNNELYDEHEFDLNTLDLDAEENLEIASDSAFLDVQEQDDSWSEQSIESSPLFPANALHDTDGEPLEEPVEDFIDFVDETTNLEDSISLEASEEIFNSIEEYDASVFEDSEEFEPQSDLSASQFSDSSFGELEEAGETPEEEFFSSDVDLDSTSSTAESMPADPTFEPFNTTTDLVDNFDELSFEDPFAVGNDDELVTTAEDVFSVEESDRLEALENNANWEESLAEPLLVNDVGLPNIETEELASNSNDIDNINIVDAWHDEQPFGELEGDSLEFVESDFSEEELNSAVDLSALDSETEEQDEPSYEEFVNTSVAALDEETSPTSNSELLDLGFDFDDDESLEIADYQEAEETAEEFLFVESVSEEEPNPDLDADDEMFIAVLTEPETTLTSENPASISQVPTVSVEDFGVFEDEGNSLTDNLDFSDSSSVDDVVSNLDVSETDGWELNNLTVSESFDTPETDFNAPEIINTSNLTDFFDASNQDLENTDFSDVTLAREDEALELSSVDVDNSTLELLDDLEHHDTHEAIEDELVDFFADSFTDSEAAGEEQAEDAISSDADDLDLADFFVESTSSSEEEIVSTEVQPAEAEDDLDLVDFFTDSDDNEASIATSSSDTSDELVDFFSGASTSEEQEFAEATADFELVETFTSDHDTSEAEVSGAVEDLADFFNGASTDEEQEFENVTADFELVEAFTSDSDTSEAEVSGAVEDLADFFTGASSAEEQELDHTFDNVSNVSEDFGIAEEFAEPESEFSLDDDINTTADTVAVIAEEDVDLSPEVSDIAGPAVLEVSGDLSAEDDLGLSDFLASELDTSSTTEEEISSADTADELVDFFTDNFTDSGATSEGQAEDAISSDADDLDLADFFVEGTSSSEEEIVSTEVQPAEAEDDLDLVDFFTDSNDSGASAATSSSDTSDELADFFSGASTDEEQEFENATADFELVEAFTSSDTSEAEVSGAVEDLADFFGGVSNGEEQELDHTFDNVSEDFGIAREFAEPESEFSLDEDIDTTADTVTVIAEEYVDLSPEVSDIAEPAVSEVPVDLSAEDELGLSDFLASELNISSTTEEAISFDTANALVNEDELVDFFTDSFTDDSEATSENQTEDAISSDAADLDLVDFFVESTSSSEEEIVSTEVQPAEAEDDLDLVDFFTDSDDEASVATDSSDTSDELADFFSEASTGEEQEFENATADFELVEAFTSDSDNSEAEVSGAAEDLADFFGGASNGEEQELDHTFDNVSEDFGMAEEFAELESEFSLDDDINTTADTVAVITEEYVDLSPEVSDIAESTVSEVSGDLSTEDELGLSDFLTSVSDTNDFNEEPNAFIAEENSLADFFEAGVSEEETIAIPEISASEADEEFNLVDFFDVSQEENNTDVGEEIDSQTTDFFLLADSNEFENSATPVNADLTNLNNYAWSDDSASDSSTEAKDNVEPENFLADADVDSASASTTIDNLVDFFEGDDHPNLLAAPNSGAAQDIAISSPVAEQAEVPETPPSNLGELSEFDELEAMLGESTVAPSVEQPEATVSPRSDAGLDSSFDDLEALLGDTPPPSTPSPTVSTPISTPKKDDEFGDLEHLLAETYGSEGLSISTKPTKPRTQDKRKPSKIIQQVMKVDVKHLDSLNNLVGELVVNRNLLEQNEERLQQFISNLLHQVQQLSDVSQRMRDQYDRSLLENSLLATRNPNPNAGLSLEERLSSSGVKHSVGAEFDALEMDRFSSFHALSQEIIELIVRVRESASDIEFVVGETEQVSRQLGVITTQLQDDLKQSRMVPFAQLADRLPRAVRDLALAEGKQVDIEIFGRETLIDKAVLDELNTPMNHLITNAIAHGIEDPATRQASGKPARGKITVRAYHQGNQTVISINDDGAGINTEKVKQSAISKGLLTPAEAGKLNENDTYELLFEPGFSTKVQADQRSGRGMGLDIVKTDLSEIRGTIHTESVLVKGTTFTIRLPLTLSISKAMFCISDRTRIAFPVDGFEDMMEVPQSQIQLNGKGQPCLPWRDTMLPFQPLADLLSYNRHISRSNIYGKQDDDVISIIILRSEGNYLALQVDQFLGESEIVIKQLEGPIPKPAGIAGATVLGDGRVMAIANVLELFDIASGRLRPTVAGSTNIAPPEAQDHEEPTVLIVDDSITVRELLSLTFSKVGYRVEQARDGQDAWEKLRAGLPCNLIFCDIEMPRMDGLELLSRLQKDENLSKIPIAMLTSRGADRHRQTAVQLGASGYFTKPYLEEELLSASQRMLKGEILVSK